MNTYAPNDDSELVALVEAAISNERPLEIVGQGSKSGLGRPVRPADKISTAALSGVSMYEPEELVMTAGAGTPLSVIRGLLDQQGQELAFEPFDPWLLYRGEMGAGTIGGLFAVNATGPRRIKAGAARDHLLGFRAVSGRGEIFKSGGRVMKNVTGYDLSKLITGAMGTLAVMTEVTFKVLPKAETERTLVVSGLEVDEALQLLRTASGSPHEVSCLAVDATGEPSPAAGLDLPVAALLRLEGPEVSVLKRRDDLIDMFKSTGAEFDTLDDRTSRRLWESIRDCEDVANLDNATASIWRISVAPTHGHSVVTSIKDAGVPVSWQTYDWAGGLVWLAVDQVAGDAGADAIRAAVNVVGGHATLMRARDEIRESVPVFHPQPSALAALTARVKEAFDPKGILNPGRMRADI